MSKPVDCVRINYLVTTAFLNELNVEKPCFLSAFTWKINHVLRRKRELDATGQRRRQLPKQSFQYWKVRFDLINTDYMHTMSEIDYYIIILITHFQKLNKILLLVTPASCSDNSESLTNFMAFHHIKMQINNQWFYLLVNKNLYYLSKHIKFILSTYCKVFNNCHFCTIYVPIKSNINLFIANNIWMHFQ